MNSITNEQLDGVAEMYHHMIDKFKKGECCEFIEESHGKLFLDVELPNIKSIDNMKIFKVSLRFKREKFNQVWLQIQSDSIRKGYDIDDEDCVCYFEDKATQMLYNGILKPMTTKKITKCVIKKYLRIAIDTLSLLKFDKYVGKFTKNPCDIKFMESWNNILHNCESISTKSSECCVCREETLTTTTCCRNKLCYYCWDKIKEKENVDINDFPELPCPMCRRDLRWK
jgi:hypothetical protein